MSVDIEEIDSFCISVGELLIFVYSVSGRDELLLGDGFVLQADSSSEIASNVIG
tara:strand:- start:905 stop:1066 length:162 start_codon:yes stop_codon:yes gene_type:complete